MKDILTITVEITPRGKLVMLTPDGKIECNSEWQCAALLCRYAGHRSALFEQPFTQTETFDTWERRGGKVKVEVTSAKDHGQSPKPKLHLTLEDLEL